MTGKAERARHKKETVRQSPGKQHKDGCVMQYTLTIHYKGRWIMKNYWIVFVLALLFSAGSGGGGGSVAPANYTVGGTVSGLSGTVVLTNNGGDDLTLTANGAFTFATAVADGGSYNVQVKTQPSGQT